MPGAMIQIMSFDNFTWYLSFLIGGFLLVLAEIFLPGGIAGVAGGIALLAAMAIGLAFFPAPGGMLSAIGIVVFGGIFLLLWVQFFPKSRAGRRIALNADGSSFKSSTVPSADMIGKHGETTTALRPAGIAVFGDRRYEVLADGGDWIPAGARIVVRHIRDGRLFVAADPQVAP